MKKIAFVSAGFTGSILPLANELLKRGYKVDLYLVIFKSQNQQEHEALELKTGNYSYGIHLIPNKEIIGVNWLVSQENFRFFLVCNIGNALGASFLKRGIARSFQYFLLRLLVYIIGKKKYDYVNMVGQDSFISALSKRLRAYPICHTFHEVYQHANGSKALLNTVHEVMELHIPIIVPSQHLVDRIVQVDSTYPAYRIPFGLFNGYKAFDRGGETISSLPARYVLFLGNVLPYKGLNTLVEAYEHLKNQSRYIKVVIAGSGYSTCLDRLKENEDFTIINRWITNAELVELIKRSCAVVCPYLSASQSGIPTTAYVFQKPVIVTNVGAMAEYVANGKTGFIINKGDAKTLAEKMIEVYTGTTVFNTRSMNDGIRQLSINWESIADTFETTLKTIKL